MGFFSSMAMLFERYSSFFYEGIRNTLIIAAFSVLIGTVLGTLMAMLRMSKVPPLRLLALAYIEFIRGTPLMVQLMFIFYGLPMIGVKFPDIPFIPDFSRFAAGIVARTLGMRLPGRSLPALARYVLFPFKLHLVEKRHAKTDGSTTFWTVAVGWWAAAIEAVLGVVYCLTLIGIPFGIKHLKLAPSFWAPNRFGVLTDVEFEDMMDSEQTMSDHRM